MLHIIVCLILQHSIQWPSRLCFSSVGSETGAKRHFFTIGSGMGQWMVIKWSCLKRNDRVILKFAFGVHSYAFLCWFRINFPKLTNFGNCGKTLDGVRAMIFFLQSRFFDARIAFSDPKRSILDAESTQFWKRSVKSGRPSGTEL